jgi:hypothetical protein
MLPVLIFVLALVSSVVLRALRPAVPKDMPLCVVNVLIATPSTVNWNELLWETLRNAFAPQQLRFSVLVECERLHDAEAELDPLLRSCAHVHFGMRRDPKRRLRRLARRFVSGDERVVVALDYRARLRQDWDSEVLRACERLPGGVALTASSVVRGEARFPCLDADGRRAPSLAFRVKDRVVPVVCGCVEFFAACPGVFEKWPPDRFFASSSPFLNADPTLEALMLQEDDSTRNVVPCERVGLTPNYDDAEAIAKFGTARAARLASKFGRDSLSSQNVDV